MSWPFCVDNALIGQKKFSIFQCQNVFKTFWKHQKWIPREILHRYRAPEVYLAFEPLGTSIEHISLRVVIQWGGWHVSPLRQGRSPGVLRKCCKLWHLSVGPFCRIQSLDCKSNAILATCDPKSYRYIYYIV